MLKQKPIKSHLEIARRIMIHIWGKEILRWDNHSPAHMYWKRWSKKNFSYLKKLSWRQIYQLIKEY